MPPHSFLHTTFLRRIVQHSNQTYIFARSNLRRPQRFPRAAALSPQENNKSRVFLSLRADFSTLYQAYSVPSLHQVCFHAFFPLAPSKALSPDGPRVKAALIVQSVLGTSLYTPLRILLFITTLLIL